MCQILEFKQRAVTKEEVIIKYELFSNYKSKEFSDILTNKEKIDYDKLYKWIKLHKSLVNQYIN